MTKQNQIHVLADETLGGTLREYVEVERKAEVGDFVIITESDYEDYGEVFAEGHIGKIIRNSDLHMYEFIADFNGFENSFVDDDGHFYLGGNESSKFSVLEPTDIVHITSDDGKSSRFRLVDRKAEVGERVIIVAEESSCGKYHNGSVIVAENSGSFGIENAGMATDDDGGNPEGFIAHREYLVLVPVEPESTSPETYDDIIANLARRVAELERQNKAMLDVYERGQKWAHERINGVKDDIETWAQEHEKTKRELDDKIEMVIDDIVTLDKRTEHVNPIKARRCCGCR